MVVRIRPMTVRWHSKDWMSDIPWFVCEFQREKWKKFRFIQKKINDRGWMWVAWFQTKEEAEKFLASKLLEWKK